MVRFEFYEEMLWRLPASKRLSFLNRQHGDAPAAHIGALTKELTLLGELKGAAVAVRAVIESTEVIFNEKIRKPPKDIVVDEFGTLAKRLALAINIDRAELQRIFPGHSFNPYVSLLLQATDRYHGLSELLGFRNSLSGDAAKKLISDLNEIVAFLRSAGNGPEMLSLIDGWARRIRKRCRSVKLYLDRLFAHHTDLLVLRLDLAYGMELTADPDTWVSPVSLREATLNMAKFDRYARANYPVVGYMHFREYGLLSGYQFHALYFLNCSLEQGESHIAHDLGKHWQKVITEGRGHYYNCKAQQYTRSDIEKTFHGDAFKRDNSSDSVIGDITKADFWIFHQDAGKCFVRGQMPPEPSGLRG